VNRPIGEILPIIFLSQLNAKYTRNPESVSYTSQRHIFLIGHDGSVAITFIKDDDELEALKLNVIQTINNAIAYSLTHNKPLDDLVEKKKTLSPLVLYESFRSLEKLDCGECGEKSCFSFVAKLYNGERDIHSCPYVDTAIVERKLRPITFYQPRARIKTSSVVAVAALASVLVRARRAFLGVPTVPPCRPLDERLYNRPKLHPLLG